MVVQGESERTGALRSSSFIHLLLHGEIPFSCCGLEVHELAGRNSLRTLLPAESKSIFGANIMTQCFDDEPTATHQLTSVTHSLEFQNDSTMIAAHRDDSSV